MSIAHGRNMNDDFNDPTIGSHVALLDRVAVSHTREHFPEENKIRFEIVRMREVCERGSLQYRRRNSDEFGKGIVTAQDTPVDIDDRHPDRRMVEGKVKKREANLGAVVDKTIFRLHACLLLQLTDWTDVMLDVQQRATVPGGSANGYQLSSPF
jgi:hypothetical protein